MRAFVAIDLPPSIQSDLAALQQRLATVLAGAQPGRSVRWIPAANLHLTLRFLGETTPAQHAAVAARLRTLAKSSGAFEITVSGLGCFPNDHRPTVLWLGVARGEERLAALQRGVEQIAMDAGFVAEGRAWQPHLTLARIARGAAAGAPARFGEEFLRASQSASLRAWSRKVAVDHIAFMQSDLRPQGAVYTALDRFALAPA